MSQSPWPVQAGPQHTPGAQAVRLSAAAHCPLVLQQTMGRASRAHCSIMSRELKYTINLPRQLISCGDKKPILGTNGEAFHNSEEEFLSPRATLPQIHSPRLSVPRPGSRVAHEVAHSLRGEQGREWQGLEAAWLQSINNPL